MSEDYVRGEMDIADQEATWTGFMKMGLWASFIIALTLTYAILTLTTIQMSWMIALPLLAVAGIVGGLLMNMGGAWIATVVGLVVLALGLEFLITIAQWML